MDEVQCPYYTSSRGHAIKCAGIIPGTALKLVFTGATDKALDNREEYMEKYCNDPYECAKCPIFRAIKKAGQENG